MLHLVSRKSLVTLVVRRVHAVVALVLASTIFQGALIHSARAEQMTDEDVRVFMAKAREHITIGTDSDGTPIPPETEAELAVPLIPLEDGRRAIDAGFASGLLQWCDLNWEANMNAFLAGERDSHNWGAKQLAYINVLHGFAMVQYVEAVTPTGACPDDVRAEAQKALNEMQGQ